MSTPDEVRAETVRMRGFIRAAETQATKVLALVDALDAPTPPPVDPPVEPPPPPPAEPPVVTEGAAFIIGPQVPLGESPWPFMDDNQVAKALPHADFALAAINGSDSDAALNSVYYDLALCLYGLHARSGDNAHLTAARNVADAWWRTMPARVGWDKTNMFSVAPRNASLGGLILRALEGAGTEPLTFSTWVVSEGKPGPVQANLWEWITGYVREHWSVWLGTRLHYEGLWFGIRDGAYALLYCAWLARVHPDAAVREEMLGYVRQGAVDYYARLQAPDGGWYWDVWDDGVAASQPFMVGLLMEALAASHQLTGDERVRTAIARGTDWLWERAYDRSETTNLPGVHWRAMHYTVAKDIAQQGYRGSAAEYGQADGAIRDARQLNATTVHAFGLAYELTGDRRYVEQGDEIAAATFGKGSGPGADAYWGLADYQAKQYCQSYRSAPQYLVYRA